MSTLRVSSINNAAASAGGIAIDSSGGVSGALPAPNRNLLYNGAMQVSQRGTSTASITAGGYYTADRWNFVPSSMGTWTQDIQNDAPTGSGFRRSLRVLCTTADAAPAAGDFVLLQQILEGQDVQRIRKGTSSAQKLTLSFWVKSNVTGTYVAELQDNDNSRFVSATYTISASATWERKTITFPADTTGALDNDNAGSLVLIMWLGAGSTWSGGSPLQTAWGTTSNTRATGQTNLAAATNNYWQVTGVQLETGDVATDFEFKSYGQELAECQRYYYLYTSGTAKQIGLGQMNSGTAMVCQVTFPTTMRSAPELVASSGTNYYRAEVGGSTDDFNSFTILRAHESGAGIYNLSEISGTAGQVRQVHTNNASASIAFSAEL